MITKQGHLDVLDAAALGMLLMWVILLRLTFTYCPGLLWKNCDLVLEL